MKSAINKLFSAEKGSPLLFLIMLYLAGVVTDSLSNALQDCFSPFVIVLVGTSIIILFILILDPIPRLVKSFTHKHGGLSPEIVKPLKHKGLIVFASKPSEGQHISAEAAIRYHLPDLKRCWIIAGDRDNQKGSLKGANDLKDKFVRDGFPSTFFDVISMDEEDKNNPIKTFEQIEHIFNNLPEGFTEADIISDYTGGTKSMTAGMILSCALPSRDLQVLIPEKYKDDGTARGYKSEPNMINIRFKLKHLNN